MKMSLRRTPLVLYIIFIFHLHHNFHSVSSLSSSVDTNKETLHLNESKPVVDVFEEKARELAVVIKRRGSGGTGGGGGSSMGGGDGGSSGSSTSGGGGGGGGDSTMGGGGGGGGGVSGQSWSNGGGRVVPINVGRNSTRGSHRSSGSQNIRGALCAASWLGLPILAGLILV